MLIASPLPVQALEIENYRDWLINQFETRNETVLIEVLTDYYIYFELGNGEGTPQELALEFINNMFEALDNQQYELAYMYIDFLAEMLLNANTEIQLQFMGKYLGIGEQPPSEANPGDNSELNLQGLLEILNEQNELLKFIANILFMILGVIGLAMIFFILSCILRLIWFHMIQVWF
jgi:hypothetical protein